MYNCAVDNLQTTLSLQCTAVQVIVNLKTGKSLEMHNTRNKILNKVFHSFTFAGQNINDDARGTLPVASPFYQVDPRPR